jgi:uncharacterized protein (DUF433 family)
MTTETGYAHIVLNENEVPIISGTTMKVEELVSAHLAYSWNAEELHDQFPYLSLGQIYSALAYYSDHQKEIDEDLDLQLKRVDEYRKAAGESPFVARMKAKGLVK